MNLLIKDFPDELQKRLKIMAINQETTVAQLIINLLGERANEPQGIGHAWQNQTARGVQN